jgi:transposase
MIKKQSSTQLKHEFVCIEDMVPRDHLLRKIDKHINFSFIHDKIKDLYSNVGRCGISPVVLFKMMLIGYLFGIRSERRLEQEIKVNVAYRWFLGLGLCDPVPDHSTISQNRGRRFNGTDIFREIFEEIVRQAIAAGLVRGKYLFTDSTKVKASANRNRKEKVEVEQSPREYLDDLEKAANDERAAHGKKPLPPASDKPPSTKRINRSLTDPDSGYVCRKGKYDGFYYSSHFTTDSHHNIITDVFVTPGNVPDSAPYLERIDRQMEEFNFGVEGVGLDAGYYQAFICKGLADRAIFGAIPYVRSRRKGFKIQKRHFEYDSKNDVYICPAGQKLRYRTTTREGFNEYASNPEICAACKLLKDCTKSKDKIRVVSRHVWQDYKDKVRQNNLTNDGKYLRQKRRETVERSFADAKELHCLRYARYRGIERVTEQCLMVAIAMNIKKMACHLCYFILSWLKKRVIFGNYENIIRSCAA